MTMFEYKTSHILIQLHNLNHSNPWIMNKFDCSSLNRNLTLNLMFSIERVLLDTDSNLKID